MKTDKKKKTKKQKTKKQKTLIPKKKKKNPLCSSPGPMIVCAFIHTIQMYIAFHHAIQV